MLEPQHLTCFAHISLMLHLYDEKLLLSVCSFKPFIFHYHTNYIRDRGSFSKCQERYRKTSYQVYPHGSHSSEKLLELLCVLVYLHTSTRYLMEHSAFNSAIFTLLSNTLLFQYFFFQTAILVFTAFHRF